MLTSTAICQLDGVGQVRRRVVALISVPCAVVPDELGIDVYSRNIVDDAADLELRVFQQMSQQCRFACETTMRLYAMRPETVLSLRSR